MAETERKAAKRTKTQSHATLYKRRYWWLSVLSCFYDWAVEAGYLRNNPVRRVHRPRLKRMLPRPIPDAELSSALRQADPQMRCWLLLGALVGLRCQEMAGLDREDILEAEGLIRVVHGKGGHERMVPLHAQVLGALVALPMPPAGALFRRKMGGRFDASRVSHEVNLFLRRTRDHLDGPHPEALLRNQAVRRLARSAPHPGDARSPESHDHRDLHRVRSRVGRGSGPSTPNRWLDGQSSCIRRTLAVLSCA